MEGPTVVAILSNGELEVFGRIGGWGTPDRYAAPLILGAPRMVARGPIGEAVGMVLLPT